MKPELELSPLPDLDEDLINGIDKFIADRSEAPAGHMSRNDAINVIVRDWLMAQGYVPLPDDPDEITTALDAADVPRR